MKWERRVQCQQEPTHPGPRDLSNNILEWGVEGGVALEYFKTQHPLPGSMECDYSLALGTGECGFVFFG